MDESVVEKSQGIGHIVPENEMFSHLIEEHGRESSSSSDFLTSETTGGLEEHSHSGSEDSSPPYLLSWSTRKAYRPDCIRPNVADKEEKNFVDNRKVEKNVSSSSGNFSPLLFVGFLYINCIDLLMLCGGLQRLRC